MRQSTKAKSNVSLLSVYPCVSRESANRAFVKSVSKPTSGGNSYLEDFMEIMKRVTANAGSFSQSDVLHASRAYDIPAPELAGLFKQWAEKMIQFGKLTEVRGCYSESVFILY